MPRAPVAHIAEQLQKQAKNVVLTAITGKAVQTLQEKLPKCLNKVVTTIHKCLGLKDGGYIPMMNDVWILTVFSLPQS